MRRCASRWRRPGRRGLRRRQDPRHRDPRSAAAQQHVLDIKGPHLSAARSRTGGHPAGQLSGCERLGVAIERRMDRKPLSEKHFNWKRVRESGCRRRRHSAIGQVAPIRFERRHQAAVEGAPPKKRLHRMPGEPRSCSGMSPRWGWRGETAPRTAEEINRSPHRSAQAGQLQGPFVPRRTTPCAAVHVPPTAGGSVHVASLRRISTARH